MRRAVLFVLGAAAGAVLAADWNLIAASALGSDWHIRRGSVVIAGDNVTAAVRHTADGKETEYRAAVPLAHCGRDIGDLVLTPATAEPVQTAVWRRGDGMVRSTIATAICAAAKVQR